MEVSVMESYKYKIEVLLDNRFASCDDYHQVVEVIKNWLACEWQIENMSMPDYSALVVYLYKRADEKIKERRK